MLPFEAFATEKKWVDFTLTGPPPPRGSLNEVPPPGTEDPQQGTRCGRPLSVEGRFEGKVGHGDNSEFSKNSEIFGRTIPNAILLFSCSSHYDSL